MADVIACGHICLDLLPRMGRVPLAGIASPGKLFEVDALDIATGGSVSNTGLALYSLGENVALMGTVGDDLLGQVIITALRERETSLGAHIKIQPRQNSSYSVVLSPGDSDRIFLHCTGTNDTFGIEDVDFDLVAQAKIFHLGYPPLLPRMYQDGGEQLTEIFGRVKASGVVTSLDMAMPDANGPSGQVDWPSILKRVLPHVDVFMPSIEETLMMLRREDYQAWEDDVLAHLTLAYLDDLAAELLAWGAGVVMFKLGRFGVYGRCTSDSVRLTAMSGLGIDLSTWVDQRAYQPAFAVDVIGTTGAGDAACGGFIAGLLHRLDFVDAIRLACAVGSCAVETADANSGITSYAATMQRIKAGWQNSEYVFS